MEEVRREKATEILLALLSKPRGVRELREAIGGSPNTIGLRIIELERAGLIKEEESGSWPYKKLLTLTEKGRGIAEMLRLETSLVGKRKKLSEEELKEKGKWLLSLLHVMGGSVEGAVRLQKLLFLLKKEGGIATPYTHSPFRLGPFCGEIYGDLMDLENAGWVSSVRELAEPLLVSLTEDGKKMAKEVFESQPDEVKSALLSLRKFGQMPLKKLLDYVYTKYPQDSRMLGA